MGLEIFDGRALNSRTITGEFRERRGMIKKIKAKLKEPYFMEDLWCDYIRPAVMGLIGAAVGIVTVIVIRLL